MMTGQDEDDSAADGGRGDGVVDAGRDVEVGSWGVNRDLVEALPRPVRCGERREPP